MGRKSKYASNVKVGDKFGCWTVVDATITGSPAKLNVECVCGTSRDVDAYTLVKGKSTSCGCQLKNRTGSNNPNWRGTGSLSGTTLYTNSVRSGYSREELVNFSTTQDEKCFFTGTTLTSTAVAVPVSDTSVVWVNQPVSSMVRELGVEGTIRVANSIAQTTTNIFDKLGMKPGGV